MTDTTEEHRGAPSARRDRGRTVHGEAANAGHRVLAPDDAEVEAYLEQALHAPPPDRGRRRSRPSPTRSSSSTSASQYAQLIARRVRELNVYSELLPHDTPWDEIERRRPKAIILSGGPASVYDDGAPQARSGASGPARIPVLGICYGVQLMAHSWAARWLPARAREYGPAIGPDHDRGGAASAASTGEQPGLDEPRRLDPRAAGRASVADRRASRRRSPDWPNDARPVRASSSTPRWSTRPAAGDPAQLRARASPAPAATWTPALASSDRRWPTIRGAGRRRQGDLRAVRRRRLAPWRPRSSTGRSATS